MGKVKQPLRRSQRLRQKRVKKEESVATAAGVQVAGVATRVGKVKQPRRRRRSQRLRQKRVKKEKSTVEKAADAGVQVAGVATRGAVAEPAGIVQQAAAVSREADATSREAIAPAAGGVGIPHGPVVIISVLKPRRRGQAIFAVTPSEQFNAFFGLRNEPGVNDGVLYEQQTDILTYIVDVVLSMSPSLVELSQLNSREFIRKFFRIYRFLDEFGEFFLFS
ncbi:uncharacterized protein LOC132790152 isoform X2 [Drosophila nasuta]|uniref:uncharacterized protein LOC132790152 isoform X1 n=1 Tax=Drosophila nasuta TaxID=42062 RepID=UPI00295F068A|nr:uncharacterized protein LOC132790152 isoform X1 [Drosophila nasuta]XP_060654580.1 uncharacterized protein LOC132790152 isoform X2 [Drosophila nasuta]